MNKIQVKDYLKISDFNGEIDNINDHITLDIKGINKLYFYNKKINNLEINILDNSKLDIYIYSNELNNINIIINQNN